MMTKQPWAVYPDSYRAREMKIIAGWIAVGESGSVVGLPGGGRSNLLGFLCYRPEVFRSYLPALTHPIAFIPVDLNNLPANDLSTLYRVILRSFDRVRNQFDPELQQMATTLYEKIQAERDPFLAQGALQELLLSFEAKRIRVVLVLNRFDSFCETASLQMINTLRGLRDDFKDILCYIAGMAQEAAYLADPTVLGQMYELLDSYICWVGAMNNSDAKNLITRAFSAADVSPGEQDVSVMLTLTGNFPALLRAVCQWWLSTEDKSSATEWPAVLVEERSIQHRLAKMWVALTQEEQYILSELQKVQTIGDKDATYRDFAKQHGANLIHLQEKGVCCQTKTGWQIAGVLLAEYIAKVKGRGRGKIWIDEQTKEIYQGQTLINNLTSLELSVLALLTRHPRTRHTKTDLIVNTWPDELRQQGVTDNSLYQVISTIRREIEPNPSEPSYLITWRGKPEGGYQFYPEGKPG